MRTAYRPLAAMALLVLAGSALASPATARREARPRTRTVTDAVVHGANSATVERRATSFDVFARGVRSPVRTGRVAGGQGAHAPADLFAFDGLEDLDGAAPSDTTGALGEGHFVGAVNSSFEIFATDGSVAGPRVALATMHPDAAGLDNFDPKVVYDRYAHVFLIAWLGQTDAPRRSFIFTTAIPSASPTDPATWCTTSFPGDPVPETPLVWADYPGLGYNETRVTITTNQFSFPSTGGSFRYAQVMVLDKTGLYDCMQPRPVPIVFVGTATQDPHGTQAFTLRPAETVGAVPGDQLMLSFELAGKGSYLTVWRLKSTASGITLKKAILPTGRRRFPFPGTQAGGDAVDLQWDAGDGRLINAFYDADRNALYAAHSVRKDLEPDSVTGGYPETVVAWYEVAPAARLKDSILSRKGTIGEPEVDLGWPSVATDGAGNLFVTYSRASAPLDEFLSAWVAQVPPGETSATQLLLRAGDATYDLLAGPERWGDYTAINRDPVDPTRVATFNQYAASTSTWQQVVNVVAAT